jgi:hypothetical protein
VVGHQEKSPSQHAIGNTSRVPNPDDAAVAKPTEATKLIEQACDDGWFQSGRKKLHRTGCVVS